MGKQLMLVSSKDGGHQQPSSLHSLVLCGPTSNNLLPQAP